MPDAQPRRLTLRTRGTQSPRVDALRPSPHGRIPHLRQPRRRDRYGDGPVAPSQPVGSEAPDRIRLRARVAGRGLRRPRRAPPRSRRRLPVSRRLGCPEWCGRSARNFRFGPLSAGSRSRGVTPRSDRAGVPRGLRARALRTDSDETGAESDQLRGQRLRRPRRRITRHGGCVAQRAQ